MITYITVGGTGEICGNPGNMLNQVAAKVGNRVEHVDLEYPASIASFNPKGDPLGLSEGESRRIGVRNLVDAIRATPNLVALSGFSLGALVVSDFLAAQARGKYGDCEVVGVVNIANPARGKGQSYGLPSNGYGLDGAHPRWPDLPVYEIANPVDLIASAPAQSPWRVFSDVIREFTFGDPAAWFKAMCGRADRLQAIQMPYHVWDAQWWQAFAEAPAWLRGYAYDGQHTVAYGKPLWRDTAGRPISGMDLAAQAVRGLA